MDEKKVEAIKTELKGIRDRIDAVLGMFDGVQSRTSTQEVHPSRVNDLEEPYNNESKTIDATATLSSAMQMEFFTSEQFKSFSRKTGSKGCSTDNLEKRECDDSHGKASRHIGISKKEAFKRFREKTAGGREIIHLGDVNEIFGYNRSTSGTFIRDAINEGKLKSISYGRGRKFLARDVRSFMSKVFPA